MPWIHFAKKNRPSFEVPAGSLLMKVILEHHVPVASSCHGDGVCAKCRMTIVSGLEHLSPVDENEKFLIEKNKYQGSVRISCQVQVFGDVTVDTGYW